MSIIIKDLKCGYDKNEIIHGISTTIESSGICCILGENGCGKTTLLRAVSGLLPYEGSIRMDDLELSEMKRKMIAEKCAILPQFNSAYFSFTVSETVLQGRYRFSGHGLSSHSAEDRDYCQKCMDDFGISDISDNTIDSLSGGQLQRVYLARTFAQDTPYIFLDEPANHLDLKHKVSLLDLIKEKNSTRSIVAVLHDIRSALEIADKVIVMHEGQIIYDGAPAAALEEGYLDKAYDIDVKSHL